MRGEREGVGVGASEGARVGVGASEGARVSVGEGAGARREAIASTLRWNSVGASDL